MFKLIILITTLQPTADYLPETHYQSRKQCNTAREHKTKVLEEHILYDTQDYNLTAYCVEVNNG